MRKCSLTRKRRDLASLLLAMLLFRAYIPIGFMPASGTPFLLELCPAASPGLPAMDMANSMDMSVPMDMSGSMEMSGLSTPTDMSTPLAERHHHHGATHAHFDNCPFGSAPAAGPVSQLLAFEPLGVAPSYLAVPDEASPRGRRLDRAHQPRGPPSLA